VPNVAFEMNSPHVTSAAPLSVENVRVLITSTRRRENVTTDRVVPSGRVLNVPNARLVLNARRVLNAPVMTGMTGLHALRDMIARQTAVSVVPHPSTQTNLTSHDSLPKTTSY